MNTSIPATETATAKNVKVTADALIVELRDGRTVSVPITWYPRLAQGSASERRRWELIGPGIGIHWPALDEDISVEACALPDDDRLTNEWSRRAQDRKSARLIRDVSQAN